MTYVRIVERMNRWIGRAVMYGIFVMIGILLWSSVSKTFFLPSLWTLEVAQFAMVAYFILGGPYSIQMGSNVRMDLFYGRWTIRQKAWVDCLTVLCLLFYLGVLLHGGISSTAYSLGYFGAEPYQFFAGLMGAFLTGGPEALRESLGHLERSPTAWRPYLWPIKGIMIFGIFLMLLQVSAELIKDLDRVSRGEETA